MKCWKLGEENLRSKKEGKYTCISYERILIRIGWLLIRNNGEQKTEMTFKIGWGVATQHSVTAKTFSLKIKMK